MHIVWKDDTNGDGYIYLHSFEDLYQFYEALKLEISNNSADVLDNIAADNIDEEEDDETIQDHKIEDDKNRLINLVVKFVKKVSKQFKVCVAT